LRRMWNVPKLVTRPMLFLLLLGFGDLLREPYAVEDWSVFAAKWVVPFALFLCAGHVFDQKKKLRQLEVFCMVVLAYLTLTAISFLLGADSLIFPTYILDPMLGIHADRARGPFLQAVANGVTLNLLGIVALDSFRRRRWPFLVPLCLAGLPVAVLATRTRAVWLSFGLTVLLLAFWQQSSRIRFACRTLILMSVLGALTALTFIGHGSSLTSRLEDRSPVEFRRSVYRAGFEMFLEKPWFGWRAASIQPQLEQRITEFHQDEFFFHNNYLELAVQHGLLGVGLYLWLIADLFRLGRPRVPPDRLPQGCLLDSGFRSLWPVMLGVYLLNACFVVMSYQFVNGLLFLFAGILAAQGREATEKASAGFRLPPSDLELWPVRP
jgi:putative inorganic carbon (HCO3(-)) transporter